MKDALSRAGLCWHGWHGFRRGLASNLNRLGEDDSVIQRILRHSTVSTTQNHYIKTASPDAIAAALEHGSDSRLIHQYRINWSGPPEQESPTARAVLVSRRKERQGAPSRPGALRREFYSKVILGRTISFGTRHGNWQC